jgi:hypothetical protein
MSDLGAVVGEGQIWKHYKGELYQIIHSHILYKGDMDNKEFILYKKYTSKYDINNSVLNRIPEMYLEHINVLNEPLFTQSKNRFLECVMLDGKLVPRFVLQNEY